MKTIRPNPHPLDYDWRFTEFTVNYLASLCLVGKILSVGAPTIAAKLTEQGRDVTLVDTHPIQDVKKHLRLDVNLVQPLNDNFEYVVIDPPWYLDTYYRWLSWAAISSGVNTKILLSIWLDSTRPLAIEEKKELFTWITSWADIEVIKEALSYEMPNFEKIILENKSTNKLRHGDLAIITVKSLPKLLHYSIKGEIWHRYIFNSYQLAIKQENNINTSSNVELIKLEEKNNWVWQSVSRRAPRRDKIQLWSSENEVAIVDNPSTLIELLDNLLNEDNFDILKNHANSILEWNIPAPPYKRKMKWLQNC